MTTPKGYGGVHVPDLRHTLPDDTPPSERLRDTLRREEAARIVQTRTVEELCTRMTANETVAHGAADMVSRFGWKQDLILAGVGASFVTIILMASWTLTSLQKATAETRTIASQEARAVAIAQADDDRRRFREEIRALLREAPRQGLASASP